MIGGRLFRPVLPLDDVTGIVTDAPLDAPEVQELVGQGVDVLTTDR